MAFALLYNGEDSQRIQDCYQAARNALSNNDRLNIDRCWDSGLSTWNSDANRVYNAVTDTWSPYCLLPDGTVNTGLCDKDTHAIAITGVWARSVAAYGAVAGATITKAGFVSLMQRMGAADPNTTRGNWIIGLADDVANTAVEPFP